MLFTAKNSWRIWTFLPDKCNVNRCHCDTFELLSSQENDWFTLRILRCSQVLAFLITWYWIGAASHSFFSDIYFKGVSRIYSIVQEEAVQRFCQARVIEFTWHQVFLPHDRYASWSKPFNCSMHEQWAVKFLWNIRFVIKSEKLI